MSTGVWRGVQPASSSHPVVHEDASLEKARTFSRQLLSAIASKHEPAKGRRKRSHMVRACASRELGRDGGAMRGMLHSLALSDTREFMPCEKYRYRGKAIQDGHRIVHVSGGMVDIDKGWPMQLEGLNDTEKIVDMLFSDDWSMNYTPPEGLSLPTWIVSLTSENRVLFHDPDDGSLRHQFHLPRFTLKFKKLGWNRDLEELFVFGYTVAMHIDDEDDAADRPARQAFCDRTPVFAVFQLIPLRFKGMLKLDKKYFSSIHSASLHDDALVAYCNQPNRAVVYDFDQIYKEFCTRLFSPLEASQGEIILPFNIEVTAQPPRRFEAKGAFQEVKMACWPPHVLLQPLARSRDEYQLRRVEDGVVPDLNGMRLLGAECVAMTIEQSTCMWHLDGTPRILRFEGIYMACYMMEDTGSCCRLRPAWKCALRPTHRESTAGRWMSYDDHPHRTSSSYGRSLRPTSRHADDAQVMAGHVAIRSLAYDGLSVLTLLIHYDLTGLGGRGERGGWGGGAGGAGAAPAPPAPPPPPPPRPAKRQIERVLSALMVDALTGEVIRATPLYRKTTTDDLLKMESLELIDHSLSYLMYDGKNTVVDVYRLTEPRQMEWLPEGVDKKLASPFVPQSLSRKEKRKRAQAARRARAGDSVSSGQ